MSNIQTGQPLDALNFKSPILIIGDGSAGRRYERILTERSIRSLVIGPKGNMDHECSGLIIASPPSIHGGHLDEAFNLQVPILCEGPVPIDYHPLTVPNMTASNWRFVHSMRELAARLYNRYIVSAHLYFDYDLALWRPDVEYTKTCYYQEGITNINLHEVDMALWLFGPAERVNVESRSTLKSCGMDAYSMMIKHASGVLTTIQSGWHSTKYRRGIIVQMQDGSSEELCWTSPNDDAEINRSYEAVVDTWLTGIATWDMTLTPSLYDGYRAYQAMQGRAI